MERIRNKLRSIFELSQEVNPAWKKINKSMADLQKEFPQSDLVKSAQAVLSAQQLHVDEAVRIADEVTARLLDPKKTVPIDLLNTKEEAGFIMNNVLLTYRTTRRPDKIQEFFTLAWTHPAREKTETANQKYIGQQLFGAYIRTNDLTQLRAHASKLFQAFKEDRYMFWSLVALALSITAEGPSAPLEIVQKYIEGQMKKDRITTQQEMDFYLQLLRQQHKHGAVIDTLRTDLAQRLVPLLHERQLGMALAHTRLAQHEQAMQLYQELIATHSADEWQYYTGYLDALMARTNDASDALLSEARTWLTQLQSQHRRDRAPYLALLELELRLLARTGHDSHRAALATLTRQYFTQFAHRPSCWRDLRMYLAALIDTEHVTGTIESCRACCQDVKSKLAPLSAEDTSALQSYIDCYTRQLNLIAMELVVQYNSAHGQALLYSPATLWALWQETVTLPIKVAPAERHPGDDAVTYLAWLTALAGSQRHDTNTVRTALAVLKRGLAVSPHNFEFKFLALVLYAALGALPAAFTLFKELEIKHMQYDTLSHLLFDRMLDFAAYNEAEHVIAKIISFHDDNKKTTPEYTLEAYKNGTYAKVGELIAFERRLSRSIQLVKAQQAQLLVSYLKSCNTLSDALQFFSDCETLIAKDLPHELADIRALSCNDDATVLCEWDLDVHRVVDVTDPVLSVRAASDDWRVYVTSQHLRLLMHFYLANRAIIKALAPPPATAKGLPARGRQPQPTASEASVDETHVHGLRTALATLHCALIDAHVIPADTALLGVSPVTSAHAPVTPVAHPLRSLTEYTVGSEQFAAQDQLVWRALVANFDVYLVLAEFTAALHSGGEGVDVPALADKVKRALATLKTLLTSGWTSIKTVERDLTKFSVWLRAANKYLSLVLQSCRLTFALLTHTYPARLKKGSEELKAAYTETKEELKTLTALIDTQLTRELPQLLESAKQQLSSLTPAAISELTNSTVQLPDLLLDQHKRHVLDACEPVLDSYRSVVFQLLDVLKFKRL